MCFVVLTCIVVANLANLSDAACRLVLRNHKFKAPQVRFKPSKTHHHITFKKHHGRQAEIREALRRVRGRAAV